MNNVVLVSQVLCEALGGVCDTTVVLTLSPVRPAVEDSLVRPLRVGR